MLWRLLTLLMDICQLRKSPADLPASTLLAWATTTAFFALSAAGEWLRPETRYFPEAPLAGLVGSFLLVAAVLVSTGYRQRLKQTWIAFTGCAVLISLPLFILALSIGAQSGQFNGGFPLSVLTMAFLQVWSIVVDAHIYRHAIGVGLSAGLAIAVMTYTLMLVLRTALFP